MSSDSEVALRLNSMLAHRPKQLRTHLTLRLD